MLYPRRALDGLLQPILLDSASSSCGCTFSSNFCDAMEEQICSNPCGTALLKAKFGITPQKRFKNDPNWGGGVIWARGKRRGFSLLAAARHSQYARGYGICRKKHFFFPSSPGQWLPAKPKNKKCELSRLNPKVAKNKTKNGFVGKF